MLFLGNSWTAIVTGNEAHPLHILPYASAEYMAIIPAQLNLDDTQHSHVDDVQWELLRIAQGRPSYPAEINAKYNGFCGMRCS